MDNQEKDFLDDVDTDIDTSFRKPKKQLSEQKLQHLANIRVKALEKKKEMKVITEKANIFKKVTNFFSISSECPNCLNLYRCEA